MTKILKRESVHGTEYMFRFNGQLFVFNNKKRAEVKLKELENGSLF